MRRLAGTTDAPTCATGRAPGLATTDVARLDQGGRARRCRQTRLRPRHQTRAVRVENFLGEVLSLPSKVLRV
jgi:hypothetical protein